MKKYLFGLVALFMAAAFSAFTISEKAFEDIVFVYDVSGGYSQGTVSDVSPNNWVPGSACGTTTDQVACSIAVPREFTIDEDGLEIDPDDIPALNVSQFGLTGRYRVTATTGVSAIINKTNP